MELPVSTLSKKVTLSNESATIALEQVNENSFAILAEDPDGNEVALILNTSEIHELINELQNLVYNEQ